MLCPNCRRWVERDASWCRSCGAVLGDGVPAMQLVLPEGERTEARPGVTLGRGSACAVRLTDPSVSRSHARITGTAALPAIADAGSATGTWVDGRSAARRARSLRDGSVVRLGDAELTVERRRASQDSGRTSIVPAHSAAMTAAMAGRDAPPSLRAGLALKRLEAGEGPRRWVLHDVRSGGGLRLDDDGAEVLRLLDGRRSLDQVLYAAEDRLGPGGPARLAALLAELSDRGMLAGTEAAEPALGRTGRLMRARSWAWPHAAERVEELYAAGGWRLFTRTALTSLTAVAACGLFAFVVLLATQHGRPFVVAGHVGIGGAVFLAGRFAVAAVHETAHGLALAACGRRVREAGLKLVLIFPYVYVDTSEAWLEPARRRIAISAAGPISDLVLGGTFALMCLASAPGVARDILFQLALGAYLGAAFNLNPFVERDGYHVLVDVLREPGLRERARDALGRRLRGDGNVPPVLWRYGALGILWSVVATGLVVAVSLRTADSLRATLPDGLVAAGLTIFCAVLSSAVVLPVARLLRGRRRTAGA